MANERQLEDICQKVQKLITKTRWVWKLNFL